MKKTRMQLHQCMKIQRLGGVLWIFGSVASICAMGVNPMNLLAFLIGTWLFTTTTLIVG